MGREYCHFLQRQRRERLGGRAELPLPRRQGESCRKEERERREVLKRLVTRYICCFTLTQTCFLPTLVEVELVRGWSPRNWSPQIPQVAARQPAVQFSGFVARLGCYADHSGLHRSHLLFPPLSLSCWGRRARARVRPLPPSLQHDRAPEGGRPPSV